MAKIVIIDDEIDICMLLRKILSEEGYVIKAETDPVKALAIVEEENPDCVLLDIKMPKMSGVEVLSAIKDLNRNTPVIMITGYGTLENAMESMKLGAYDYITKPFDIDYIKNMVTHALKSEK
jgi:DNA-binding NtrC family response regulator